MKWFIPGNVPSSKNGRRWTGKYFIASKGVVNYRKKTKSYYEKFAPEFKKELAKHKLPVTIAFEFIRGSKHKFDYIIFDSLTSLLVYQKKAPVSKFVSSLINKIKTGETKAIFYALSAKEQAQLIKESSMFVDKVVDIGKVDGNKEKVDEVKIDPKDIEKKVDKIVKK